MIFKSLKTGFGRAWHRKRVIIVFYLTNLLMASVLALPISAMIDSFAGKSMVRERLGAGMDWDFLFEFIDHYSTQLANMELMFLLAPLAFTLLIIFLSGGAISQFIESEKYAARDFWGNCARYFGRYLRLVLWSLPVLVVPILLYLIPVGIERLIYGADPYENAAYWFEKAQLILIFAGMIIYGLILDYSRIYMVLTDERKSRKAVWHAVKLVYGHVWRTFVFSLILFITGGIALFIYYHVSNLFSSPSLVVVLLLILFQQIYIVWRVILRLTFYSGQIELYKQLAPSDTGAVYQ